MIVDLYHYLTAEKILLIAVLCCHLPYTLGKIRKYLHMLQLNSYRNKRYLKWLGNLSNTSLTTHHEIWGVLALIPTLFSQLSGMVILGLFYLAIFFTRKKTTEKKPLVYTPRAIRIFVTSILLLLCCYTISIKVTTFASTTGVFFVLLGLLLTTFTVPLWLLLSNTLLLPLEKAINFWYFNDAKKRILAMPKLKIIGITGSYGKTTTKYVLAEILRQKYHVLMPPGSFNTPMGISKIIRSQLAPTHEIFVAEMSAKQKGDIAELCSLAKPNFGIITAIGKQHLETFGSFANIKKTKNELIENLPNDGVAFFNMDDTACQELAALTNKRKIYYGIYASNLDYRAQNIQITENGSTFDVVKYNEPPVTFTTRLLGQHNIYNILAAIAAAAEYGMELTAMLYPIRQLRPIEHRLELKKLTNNIIFIDDAFNSNPVGSKMALDVLNQINSTRKIIVTPGMIELGDEEYVLNKQFGNYIADTCHYVILVGKKQTQAILAGLNEKNFNNNDMFIARDFAEANRHLHGILQPGDVVLFENDLPDSYQE